MTATGGYSTDTAETFPRYRIQFETTDVDSWDLIVSFVSPLKPVPTTAADEGAVTGWVAGSPGGDAPAQNISAEHQAVLEGYLQAMCTALSEQSGVTSDSTQLWRLDMVPTATELSL